MKKLDTKLVFKNKCRNSVSVLQGLGDARRSEKCAAKGFHYMNSFILNFFGPNTKTYTCEVHASRGCVSRGLAVIQFQCESEIQNDFEE